MSTTAFLVLILCLLILHIGHSYDRHKKLKRRIDGAHKRLDDHFVLLSEQEELLLQVAYREAKRTNTLRTGPKG